MSDQDIVLKFLRDNYNSNDITLKTNLTNEIIDSMEL